MKIGFVGTGIMGGHMARRLAAAGASVHAWNRSAAKVEALAAHGVMRVATPSAALDGADVAIVMLSSGPVCDAVLFDADDSGHVPAEALASGATLVVMSSIPVETARAQAARVSGRGVRYVDAPVSGGESGARDGTLAIMAGGEVQTVRDVAQALTPLGRVTHLGPAGSGQLAKLANQIIVGGTIAIVGEALLFAAKAGADPTKVRQALMDGFANSRILEVHGERMVKRTFDPGFRIELHLKDLSIALTGARSLQMSLPLTAITQQLMNACAARGGSGWDHSATVKALEQLANFEIGQKSGHEDLG